MLLKQSHEIAKTQPIRPGCVVVDCVIVGLPIYVSRLATFVETRRELGLTSECVIKLVKAGISKSETITRLLGLTEELSVRVIAELVRSDLLSANGRTKGELAVTEAGLAAVETAEQNVRIGEETVIQFDGILRKPISYPRHLIESAPAILRRGGILISPVPAKRPEVADFSPEECTEQLSLIAYHRKRGTKVLKIRDVLSSHLKYVSAVAVVYKEIDSGKYFIAFLMEGQASGEHESAYAQSDSFSRQAVTAELRGITKSRISAKNGYQALRRAVGDFISRSRNPASASTLRVKPKGVEEIGGKTDDYVSPVRIEESLDEIESMLISAKKEIVIATSQLQSIVLQEGFYSIIESKLTSGVDVVFIAEAQKTHRADVDDSTAKLLSIAKRYGNFNLDLNKAKLPDLLIVDSTKAFYCSFPLLGYCGDRERKFRDDWAACVSLASWVARKRDEIFRRLRNSEKSAAVIRRRINKALELDDELK